MSSIIAEPGVIARVWLAVLRKDDPSPLVSTDAAAGESGAFRIDVDGLDRPLLMLPITPRSYVKLAVERAGKLFLMDRDLRDGFAGIGPIVQTLYRFDISTRRTERAWAGIEQFALSPDGATLLLSMNGDWTIGAADAPPAAERTRLPVEVLAVDVDPRAEWTQMYREAWRTMRKYFIDPAFHSQDLEALERSYAKYLPSVVRRSDLNALFREMFSHMSVSHMNLSGVTFRRR